MSKITIIGAGNVGATAAMNIARMSLCDEVVLLDIKDGVAEGKAMDINQALMVFDIDTHVQGVTNIYGATHDSDIVVITSGVPRKPGMTREELVGVNKGVVESVMDNLMHNQNKDTIYIVVSNPMDTMTQVVLNKLRSFKGYDIPDVEKKVIGMGGLLDSNRFRYNIRKVYENKNAKRISSSSVTGYVLGGHGDKMMVPWGPSGSVNEYPGSFNPIGTPLNELFTQEEIFDDIIPNTKTGGAILTKMLGTSAWEAPAAAIARTCELIMKNNSNVGLTSSVWRKEYNLCIGSYVTLCRQGVKEIYNVEGQDVAYSNSVHDVREVNQNI